MSPPPVMARVSSKMTSQSFRAESDAPYGCLYPGLFALCIVSGEVGSQVCCCTSLKSYPVASFMGASEDPDGTAKTVSHLSCYHNPLDLL